MFYAQHPFERYLLVALPLKKHFRELFYFSGVFSENSSKI